MYNIASLGLMDYKARMYDPTIGRFIQPDLIVSNPTNPQTWNRYSYVSNNPINFTDPSGHACHDNDYSGHIVTVCNPPPAPTPPPATPPASGGDSGTNKNNSKQDHQRSIIGASSFPLLPNNSDYMTYHESVGDYGRGYGGYYRSGSPAYGDGIAGFGANAMQVAAGGYGSAPSVVDDILSSFAPAFQKALASNSQIVNIGYTTQFQNVPQVNGTRTTTLTDVTLTNSPYAKDFLADP